MDSFNHNQYTYLQRATIQSLAIIATTNDSVHQLSGSSLSSVVASNEQNLYICSTVYLINKLPFKSLVILNTPCESP